MSFELDDRYIYQHSIQWIHQLFRILRTTAMSAVIEGIKGIRCPSSMYAPVQIINCICPSSVGYIESVHACLNNQSCTALSMQLNIYSPVGAIKAVCSC